MPRGRPKKSEEPEEKSAEETSVDDSSDSRKNARIKYGDMMTVKVKCKFTMPFMGGQPTGHDDPSQELYKDLDGDYIIPGRCFRAMFREAAKYINRSGTETGQITTFPAKIGMNGSKVERVSNIPVLSRTGGKGFISAEVITAGAEFEATFDVPTKAITKGDFEMLIKACARMGTGAYRKGDFGRFDVLDIQWT